MDAEGKVDIALTEWMTLYSSVDYAPESVLVPSWAINDGSCPSIVCRKHS